MLKKTIEYTDYDGNVRKEDFYFNLTRGELLEMEMSVDGGMQKLIEQIVQRSEAPKVFNYFKKIIEKAYGEKSLDGKRFVKDPEATKAFMETEAYSELIMELLTEEGAAAAFVTAITPKAPQDRKEPEDRKSVEG